MMRPLTEIERLNSIIDQLRLERDEARDEAERLKAALWVYLSEYDTPVPDLRLRVRYRERLKALVGGRK